MLTWIDRGAESALGEGLTSAPAARDAPCRLIATTEKVYVTPFCSPVTTQWVDAEDAQLAPPGEAVTTYRTIAEEPASEGVDQVTVAEVPAMSATTS
jgi:hypothetical protein